MTEIKIFLKLIFQGAAISKKVNEDANDLISSISKCKELSNKKCVLDLAKERLQNLEKSIERRYLKAPFAKGLVLLIVQKVI